MYRSVKRQTCTSVLRVRKPIHFFPFTFIIKACLTCSRSSSTTGSEARRFTEDTKLAKPSMNEHQHFTGKTCHSKPRHGKQNPNHSLQRPSIFEVLSRLVPDEAYHNAHNASMSHNFHKDLHRSAQPFSMKKAAQYFGMRVWQKYTHAQPMRKCGALT